MLKHLEMEILKYNFKTLPGNDCVLPVPLLEIRIPDPRERALNV